MLLLSVKTSNSKHTKEFLKRTSGVLPGPHLCRNKMENKQCSIKEVDNDINEYYDCVMTPNNAPVDNKTGFTFKGSDVEYLKGHKVIMEMVQKKGDRFVINGSEISIVDNPPKSSVIGLTVINYLLFAVCIYI